jgi:nucleotide-binding universal stress UspA family protein
MAPSAVICGIDTTEGALDALRVAGDFASRLGLPLVVAHATSGAPARHPPVGGGLAPPVSYSGPRASDEVDEGELRRRIEPVLSGAGLDSSQVALHTEAGEPADVLRRVAAAHQAELLVVGSRGRGRATAALLGSTSHSLAGDAPCPVLVVPPAG